MVIAWNRGGWTGSLNRWVDREVREQMRDNPAARRARYPLAHRLLRAFFSVGTFGRFVAIYLAIDVSVIVTEAFLAWFAPQWLPAWSASGFPPATDIKTLITNVTSYFVTAQVGVLGVVSIALALVTLIAQRDAASTDVKVYYHEALAFEIVASCIALLAVLCIQVIWPLQFLLHKLGGGTVLQTFKLVLLTVHLAWLLMNLTALAHFVATTFRFVQQSARESLRERYTANVVLPREMRRQLRPQMYAVLGAELSGRDDGGSDRTAPAFVLGLDFDNLGETEIKTDFKRPMVLHDVRAVWVRWVFQAWSKRCERHARTAPVRQPLGLGRPGPQVIFVPKIGRALRGGTIWCHRRGGVPLTWLERQVLTRAFRFRSAPHAA